MWRFLYAGILGLVVYPSIGYGDENAEPRRQPAQEKAATSPAGDGQAATAGAAKTAEAKLLAALKEALERNSRELKELKEQYSKEIGEQRKTVESQRKQIETLEKAARGMEERLKAQPATPPAPPAQPGAGPNAQQLLNDLQQKQIRLLQEQVQVLADQLEKEAPIVENLENKTATLESRGKQAAQRDKELADAHDMLLDSVDAQQRNFPWLPAQLKEWFLPSGTNVTPVSMWSTLSTRYDIFPSHRGYGYFQFEEYTPFFLVQLNKWILFSAEVSFNQSGAALGQGQLDFFLTDWLTADLGYFLAPIGYYSERLDPRWINKLPDGPVVMNQVIPDGLAMTGLQLRGAKYLFGSPVKMEYALAAGNGFGIPGSGMANDWYDQGGIIGTTANVNEGMLYVARLGFWLPTRGINFGVSELVNAPYGKQLGAVVNVIQPYFNYHRGNWDFRFEGGQHYERTHQFIGSNINRVGMYAQLAYRNYASLHKHIQRLEYVFRFSDAFFHGINPKKVDLTTYSPLSTAPLDRNQYTLGINYYLYPSVFLKFAYEFNSEINRNLHDNVFMMQFSSNF
jgi:hypothetical protein